MRRLRAETRLLLFYLDQAFGRRGWHGTTLGAAVRAVTPRQALWRPRPGRHNIWELVLHTAFWKYEVRRRLTGGDGRAFPHPGDDWPRLPERADARAWKQDVALLRAEHACFCRMVERFPAGRLHRRMPGTRFIPMEQIQGIAAHDLYHCGQIQLLKRLQK
ncbi:MAG: DinB family protein [Gemmatimonadetes bacterium]|nr:DinB family protein [Gemmatimonadota bacterium]